jgi:hypothetical protein
MNPCPIPSSIHCSHFHSELDATYHELDRLATPRVDEEEADPVAWDQTCDAEDDVADRDVLQRLVDLGFARQRRRAER